VNILFIRAVPFSLLYIYKCVRFRSVATFVSLLVLGLHIPTLYCLVTEELCDASLLVSVVGNVCFVLLLQDVALWRVAFVFHVLEVFVLNILAKT
jgi:hypothetical protein